MDKVESFQVPPDAKSWVEVAPDFHFPIQNLPFGTIAPKGRPEAVAIAIGDYALDLFALAEHGLIDGEKYPFLTGFLGLERQDLSDLRRRAFDLLSEGNDELQGSRKAKSAALIPLNEANPQAPIVPNAFVDFYSGIHHAGNVGRMFRPDQEPLLPNYRHLPVGYNGRASSVVGSGAKIVRPKGQILGPDGPPPTFQPCKNLDFELEMGFYTGSGNEMGKRITMREAESRMLGLVIVNDWSARDIQRWEYQPLGPFLSKSFATSVSPWIVTLDALEPFRIEGMEQEPEPLAYLRRTGRQHFDVVLEVWLQSARMSRAQRIARSNMKYLYWSMAQQLVHQTSNGTPIEYGDLYASGTISGPEPDERGSMLELAWKGDEPILLEETGEKRVYLEDGDTLTMTAWAQGEGYKVGFGDVRGTIAAARE